MNTGTAALLVLALFVVLLWLMLKTRPSKEARFKGSSFTGPSTLEIPNSAVTTSTEKECLLVCKAVPLANAYTFDPTTKVCQPFIVRKNFTVREDDRKNSMVFDCVC
ncbi:conserved putative secreted protein [Tokyovirus A1]|uniref:conserved putative secreted protein n=1 Tax=Tokyovirus A1 TaxID=1826170 RepID=UPI0007A9840E|nr:conserved putative secreted protein [Tokyovirus A1]BAU80256.1 conserved putative secreted protein [Tokyovirus A1]